EDGTLRDDTFRSITEDVAQPYLLRDGDLLFARSGATAGKTLRYQADWGRAAYAGYLIRARINSVVCQSRFLEYFTASLTYWNWLHSSSVQATIQNVSAERYSNLLVPLPEPAEQLEIVSYLDQEAAKIGALLARVREA